MADAGKLGDAVKKAQDAKIRNIFQSRESRIKNVKTGLQTVQGSTVRLPKGKETL